MAYSRIEVNDQEIAWFESVTHGPRFPWERLTLDPNLEFERGMTFLHYACLDNSVDEATALLNLRADVNALSTDGYSPLDCAIFGAIMFEDEWAVDKKVQGSMGYYEKLVRLLLKHGADPVGRDLSWMAPDIEELKR